MVGLNAYAFRDQRYRHCCTGPARSAPGLDGQVDTQHAQPESRMGTGCQPTGPRGTPRPACVRRLSYAGLCSAVPGLTPPCSRGAPGSCRRAECGGLCVTGLRPTAFPQGGSGLRARRDLFTGAGWGSRLCARGRRGRLRRVAGKCAGLGSERETECPLRDGQDGQDVRFK